MKKSIVFNRPESKVILGFQDNLSLANEISGFLCTGSSIGNEWNEILDVDFVSSIIFLAISIILISSGFPKLTGPTRGDVDRVKLIIPSTKSST